MKGFFLVDLVLVVTLVLIFQFKKPERFAGPYMAIFMLGVATIMVFSGKTPVTSLGSWWPLWIFWTIMIEGPRYGYLITAVAIASAAIFLFGSFAGTPNAFDFGLTAEGWSRILLVDLTFVSLVGHMVTTLFQHFLKVTHQRWLQARNNANLEIRFRMLSRFARHIYETLAPEIMALQTQCHGILENSHTLDSRPDRLAELREAKKKIEDLALVNQKMLAFTQAMRTDRMESLQLQTLMANVLSVLQTLLMESQLKVVVEAPKQTRVSADTAAVVQLFLASVFLTAYGDRRIQIKQLKVLELGHGAIFLLEGTCLPNPIQALEELCNDCHRLLDAGPYQASCSLQTQQETFFIQTRVMPVA